MALGVLHGCSCVAWSICVAVKWPMRFGVMGYYPGSRGTSFFDEVGNFLSACLHPAESILYSFFHSSPRYLLCRLKVCRPSQPPRKEQGGDRPRNSTPAALPLRNYREKMFDPNTLCKTDINAVRCSNASRPALCSAITRSVDCLERIICSTPSVRLPAVCGELRAVAALNPGLFRRLVFDGLPHCPCLTMPLMSAFTLLCPWAVPPVLVRDGQVVREAERYRCALVGARRL